MSGIITPPELRFWYRVLKGSPNECWLWLGSKNGRYGVIGRGGKDGGNIYAHRLSYEIAYGEIPADHFVIHNCDIPLCVNPRHLRVGTPADNSADMVKRGRVSRVSKSPGEKNRHAKLTDNKVRALRKAAAEGASTLLLMKRYKIGKAMVNRIIRRGAWKHIS